MRVAAIDIGTNTVLLLVAETTPRGLEAVEEHATITRLGEGVDTTRRLAPAAIARTRACIDDYAAIVKRAGVDAVDVVGTSAMRDAGGSEELRAHVIAQLGVPARVVSGDEEARLTFAGALSGLDVERAARDASDDTGEVVVFDIGGGSTEVVRGRVGRDGATSIVFARSFDVGSVRLTERHVRSDPPTRAEREAIERDLATTFAELGSAASPAARASPSSRAESASLARPASVPVGIAGTMTTLAAVELGLVAYDGARVHGHTMTRDALAAVVERLAALPLAARCEVAGVHPKRADVIVAGGLVALAVLDRLGASQVRVSDRGVRWGLALDLAHGRSPATV